MNTEQQPSPGNQEPVPNQGMDRRGFLYLLAGLGGTTLACTVPETLRRIISGEFSPLTESEKRSRIRYGFNTHMSGNPSKYENLDLNAFKVDVLRMRQMGMDAIRFNVWEWELDEIYLQKYDEALKTAKDNGMEVFLVTNVPNLSKNGEDLEGDLKKTRALYERLAGRWKGLVDVWQIFNEPDDHTYDRYQRIQSYAPGYLENLARLVYEADKTIKTIDPAAKTTVNVSMWVDPSADPWVGADNPRFEEVGLFDAVCGFESGGRVDRMCQTIDYISLDPYLDKNTEAINRFPEVIDYFYTRYQKPVVVAELGLPTGDGRFTEEDQGKYISMVIDAIQGGKVRPYALLLYEFRDEAMKAGAEASFGFNRADGTPKPGLVEILEVIQNDEHQPEK
ncbi:cellulase family glycosylhydrolase [Patescibacteria group bacterium]|nr:cellulase family glycosylhydrolase [Patescibacteria group bacterium]